MIPFIIHETDHCRQLESFLRNRLPHAPGGYLRRLIRSGAALVNGSTANIDTLLLAGDEVKLKESARTRELLSHTPPSLDILYEDDLLLVVNKTGGLPMHHTAEAEGNLVEAAELFLSRRGTPCKLRPVNRLDRGTSGAVLLAKSSRSAGMFGRFVKEEGLGKLYLAVVEGRMEEELTIAEPLDDKEAETVFTLLHAGEKESFVCARPVTGRMHQIRRHLSLAGYPIPGDARYGGRHLAGYQGLPLHSFRTTLVHPETGSNLRIFAPLPDDLLALLRFVAAENYDDILHRLPLLP